MRKENGQAILETALVLPIMLLIFCGIIDFGRILYAMLTLNMVSQEAVRLAGIGQSDIQVVQFVNNKVDLNYKESIKVNLSPNDAARKPGDYVTLDITYEINYITPFISKFIPSPHVVDTKSTIRVE